MPQLRGVGPLHHSTYAKTSTLWITTGQTVQNKGRMHFSAMHGISTETVLIRTGKMTSSQDHKHSRLKWNPPY